MKNITISIWRPSIVGTALILSIPILTIAISVFEPTGENWQHLKDTVLKEYIVNSMLLTCGVGIGTLGLEVATHWLPASGRCRGKKEWVWVFYVSKIQY